MQEKIFPEQDELVLCTVDKIVETTVFVKIDNYNKEGVISTSEIAPGRIRNIRDYVRPNKKIVCKVLRVQEQTGHIDLSLRRVSLKEKTKILSDFEKEKNAFAIMRTVLKERTDEVVSKIKKEYESILDFIQNASENDYKRLGLNESEAQQLLKIIKEKPQKNVFVKTKISITSDLGDGMIKIRGILLKTLEKHKKAEMNYLSSPLYSLIVTSTDYKEANREMEEIINEITAEGKANGCKVEVVK